MSNSRKNTPSKSRRIVTLDDSQFAQYQHGDIELRAPNGELLETLGKQLDASEAEISMFRARYQLAMLGDLLRNAHYPIELSEQGGIGLVETIDQAQQFLT